MSIPWLILAVVVVFGGVALVMQRRRSDEVRKRLDLQLAEEREKATRAITESRARVKRIERQSHHDIERAEHRLLRDLLPLMDAIESAEQSASQSADGVRKGLELVAKQLDQILERHGVERIHPDSGVKFDPSEHEAVEVRETDSIEPGVVVECHRTGFRQGADILRAAMVAVSKPAEVAADEGSSPVEVELGFDVEESSEEETKSESAPISAES